MICGRLVRLQQPCAWRVVRGSAQRSVRKGISSWDGRRVSGHAAFEVLGHEPVDASLVRRDAHLAVGGLADLADDPVAAGVGVLHPCLGLAISLEVAALDASIKEAVSA